jgi:hypothetical protein
VWGVWVWVWTSHEINGRPSRRNQEFAVSRPRIKEEKIRQVRYRLEANRGREEEMAGWEDRESVR